MNLAEDGGDDVRIQGLATFVTVGLTLVPPYEMRSVRQFGQDRGGRHCRRHVDPKGNGPDNLIAGFTGPGRGMEANVWKAVNTSDPLSLQQETEVEPTVDTIAASIGIKRLHVSEPGTRARVFSRNPARQGDHGTLETDASC